MIMDNPLKRKISEVMSDNEDLETSVSISFASETSVRETNVNVSFARETSVRETKKL